MANTKGLAQLVKQADRQLGLGDWLSQPVPQKPKPAKPPEPEWVRLPLDAAQRPANTLRLSAAEILALRAWLSDTDRGEVPIYWVEPSGKIRGRGYHAPTTPQQARKLQKHGLIEVAPIPDDLRRKVRIAEDYRGFVVSARGRAYLAPLVTPEKR